MKPTAFKRSNLLSKAFPCSIILSLLAAMPAAAANRSWSGSAGDGGLWNTAGNWTTTLLLDGTDGLRFAGTNVTNNNDITAGTNPGTLGTSWFASLSFINNGTGGTGTSSNADSAFNLTGNAVTLGNSGAITTFASTAVINDTISLDVAMTNNNPTITTNTNHNLTIAGILSGPTGSVTKAGAGTLTLSGGANTYTGRTVVSLGTLVLSNSLALQNSALDTTGAGFVNLSGITTLTLGGLTGATGDLASVITTGYSGLTALTLKNSATRDYSGVIADGAAGMTLTKIGTGTQTLSGTSANTYTGVTSINEGTLSLNKTGVNAIAGNISVGDSVGDDVLQLGAGDQIADASVITLNGTTSGQRGQFLLNGFNETIGGLSGNGLVQNGSPDLTGADSVLTLNVATATTQTSAAFIRNTGTSSTKKLSLVKTGLGTQVLTGALSYTGSTAINGGTLAIHTASNPNTSAITFSGGGVLGLDIAYTVDASPKPLATPPYAGAAVDFTGGTVAVSGTPTAPNNYTLLRAPSMAGGTPTLATPITDYELQVFDTGTEKQLRLVYTGVAGAPEIAVEQPALTDISSGGSQGFGTVTIGSNASLTFTIRNSGAANLNLTGTPDLVAVSGTNAADFTVTAVPTSPVTAGNTTTFTVQFAPGASGARSALLTIANNDSDEGTFTINVSGTGQTPYEAWAGGAAFDADANGDGVKNGLAFLLGASGPNVSALNKLPTVTQSSGNLVMTFQCLKDASRGSASLSVEHSSNLGISDAWLAAPVTDAGTSANNVSFSVSSASATLNNITATVSNVEAASGKLFGRLKSTGN